MVNLCFIQRAAVLFCGMNRRNGWSGLYPSRRLSMEKAMNKKRLAAVSALAAAIGVAGAAHAATYDFGYASTSGPFEFGDGSFTTNAAGMITSVGAGFVGTDGTFTTIVAGAPSSFAGADNMYYGTSPHFDFAGFSFATASGVDVNLASDFMAPAGAVFPAGTTYTALDSAHNPNGLDTGTVSPITLDITEVGSAVPEPSLWALMIAGVGMIGGMFRIGRRRGWALGGATA